MTNQREDSTASRGKLQPSASFSFGDICLQAFPMFEGPSFFFDFSMRSSVSDVKKQSNGKYTKRLSRVPAGLYGAPLCGACRISIAFERASQ